MPARLITFLLLAVLMCGQLQAMDETAMLQAIALKENSHGKVGAKGELGDYQMLPCNVNKYGGYGPSHALAMMHDIVSGLKRNGVDVNSFNIALAWNAGLTGATTGKAPISSYKYALSVQMNYYSITRKKQSGHHHSGKF